MITKRLNNLGKLGLKIEDKILNLQPLKTEKGMNLERLRSLEQYAREDPMDPFPRYALALEWVTTDPKKAEQLFAQLLIDHPDYLPVYYHAAHLYVASRDPVKAKGILEKGIQLARDTGDPKAQAELQSLLGEVEDRE
jgi:hypothetical protein